MKIVISGYYGENSHSNNAMLSSIIADVKSVCEKAGITVLSSAPQETKKNFNVAAVHKYNIFAVICALLKSDLLILGGGTLIQDKTSTKSLLYYLGLIRIAKQMRKKVALYANGFSSLTSFKNSEMVRDVLDKVDLITLRDEDSVKELESIGVTNSEIHLTAPPAFLLASNDDGREALKHYGVPEDKPLLCLSVKNVKKKALDFIETMSAFCDYAAEKYGFFPILMPLDKRSDYGICTSVKNKMRNKSVVVGANYSPEDLLSVIKEMHVCVSMGAYPLIYSSISGVPTVGICSFGEKAFFDYIAGEEYVVNMDSLDEKAMKEKLDNICNDYEMIESDLKFNGRILKGRARENRELLEKLIFGDKKRF